METSPWTHTTVLLNEAIAALLDEHPAMIILADLGQLPDPAVLRVFVEVVVRCVLYSIHSRWIDQC